MCARIFDPCLQSFHHNNTTKPNQIWPIWRKVPKVVSSSPHLKIFDPPHIAASFAFPPRHLSSGQPLRCIVFQWHKLCKFPAFTSKIALIGHVGVGNEPVAHFHPARPNYSKTSLRCSKLGDGFGKTTPLIDLDLLSFQQKSLIRGEDFGPNNEWPWLKSITSTIRPRLKQQILTQNTS